MRLILTALAVLVTGCASAPAPDPQSTPTPKATVNLSGFPAEFKQGYADGCLSARPNTARTRNEERYKSDTNYAQGWRDGYDICRRRK